MSAAALRARPRVAPGIARVMRRMQAAATAASIEAGATTR